MDEVTFRQQASPEGLAFFDAMTADQQRAFLLSLPEGPRTAAPDPRFQAWYDSADEATRQAFDGLDPAQREQAIQAIIGSQMPPGGPRQYNYPYLHDEMVSGLASDAVGYIGDTVGGVADWLFGGNSGEPAAPLPEGVTIPQPRSPVPPLAAAQILLGNVVGTDQEQRTDIIGNAVPGSQFYTDDLGSTLVQFGDQPVMSDNGQVTNRYYLGGPAEEATRIVGQALPYMAGGRLGAEAFSGATGRMLGVGAAEGLVSAGLDAAATALGSNEGINLERAALSAAIGGTFEALTPAVMRGLTAVGRALREPSTITNSGRLSPDMVAILNNFGIDPASITPELALRVRFFMDRGEAPGEAVVRAAAERYGIPLTRGEALAPGDPRRFAAMQQESAMERGAYGEAASHPFQEFRQQQLTALDNSRGALAEAVGTQNVDNVTAGNAIRDPLVQTRDAAHTAASDLYTVARENGVEIDMAALRQIAPDLRVVGPAQQIEDIAVRLQNDVAIAPGSPARRALDELERWFADRRTVPLEQLETMRRGLNTILRSSDPAQAYEVQTVIRAFDEWLDSIPDTAITAGTREGLDAFREARAGWREFRQNFTAQPPRSGALGREAQDYGGQTIERIANDPNMAPERVGNEIFGSGTSLGGAATAQRITRLIDTLGADHPTIQGLRMEGFRRIFDGLGLDEVTRGTMRPETYAANVVRRLTAAFRDNPTVMNQLFTNQQQRALREYMQTMAQLIPAQGAVNRSGSGTTGMRIVMDAMRNLVSRGFGIGLSVVPSGIISQLGQGAVGLVNRGAAATSTRGVGPFAIGRGMIAPIAVTGANNAPDVAALANAGYEAILPPQQPNQ